MSRAKLSYSSKDYESIRRELLARIPQLTDNWTDHNESDLGMVLLELFCGVGDMLAYYLDTQAAEAYLPTARQRQNVMALCKLIGYRLHGPVAATTTLRFTTPSPLKGDLLIPRGTVCRAKFEATSIPFETAFDATLPRGQVSLDVGARQGQRAEEEFETGGQPWERFELYASDIAQSSMEVRVDDEAWSEVPHFEESEGDSRHFVLETDGLDKSRIIFGDGITGALLPPDKTLRVSYLKTLGAGGNLGRGLIREVRTPVYFGAEQVALSVTNPVPATGGSGRESTERARRQAPAVIRSLWKGVTKDDYRALAESFPGIAKARILDVNDCANIHYFQVNLVVAPEGGGPLSPLLKKELGDYLEARKVVTTEIKLFSPAYHAVAVDADVFVFAGVDAASVHADAIRALEDHFAFDRMDFGTAVYHSDLVALLDGVRGVSHVRVRLPVDDTLVQPGEIPTLGEVNLVMKVAS